MSSETREIQIDEVTLSSPPLNIPLGEPQIERSWWNAPFTAEQDGPGTYAVAVSIFFKAKGELSTNIVVVKNATGRAIAEKLAKEKIFEKIFELRGFSKEKEGKEFQIFAALLKISL